MVPATKYSPSSTRSVEATIRLQERANLSKPNSVGIGDTSSIQSAHACSLGSVLHQATIISGRPEIVAQTLGLLRPGEKRSRDGDCVHVPRCSRRVPDMSKVHIAVFLKRFEGD